MGAEFEEDLGGSEVGDAAALGQALLVGDDVDLGALAQGGQQVGLLLDHLLFGDDVGGWADLRRKVDAGGDGPQAACDFVDLLELGVDCFEVLIAAWEVFLKRNWIGSDGDALDLSREVGQFLVEFLADEWHHRMQTPQPMFETGEESERSQLLFFFAAGGEDGLGGLEVDIAELILPEVVESVGSLSECVAFETAVDDGDHAVQLAQDPAVEEVLLHRVQLDGKVGDEVELGLSELVGLPDLVAEVPEADDLVDVEVDAPALDQVRQQAEPQRIGSALRDALRVLVLQLLD